MEQTEVGNVSESEILDPEAGFSNSKRNEQIRHLAFNTPSEDPYDGLDILRFNVIKVKQATASVV
jgi:hypothetical protein